MHPRGESGCPTAEGWGSVATRRSHPAVVGIVRALGFFFNRQEGSHAHYERAADGVRPRCVVTVDMSVSPFSIDLIKSMIRQSGFSREGFYGATAGTRKKIR